MESRVNLNRKEGHLNMQPSTKPIIGPGTSGLRGRDLTTGPTPPLFNATVMIEFNFEELELILTNLFNVHLSLAALVG